jgi:hypothetical protein
MEKLKKVSFETPKGKRHLIFSDKGLLDKKEDKCSCDPDGRCPYGEKACEAMRNPMAPDDKDQNFMDFCVNVEELDKDLMGWIPIEGTVEENVPDLIGDYFDTLREDGGYVKLNDVIDGICSDACPLYNKEHSDCTTTNEICMIHNLLKKRKD